MSKSSSSKELKTKELYLGETMVNVLIEEFGSSGYTYLNLHSNETTSVQAAREIVTRGTLITLEHGEKSRNISFILEGKKYVFDPNRIFSEVGIRNTLKKLSEYGEEARREVENFSTSILDQLYIENSQHKLIVALHNNNPNSRYSIESYLAGGSESAATADIFISDKWHKDDFFLVTTKKLFDYFKENNFNVVLQNNMNPLEDGSLSVYCGKNDISYINVEAQHGHLEQQKEMLIAVERINF